MFGRTSGDLTIKRRKLSRFSQIWWRDDMLEKTRLQGTVVIVEEDVASQGISRSPLFSSPCAFQPKAIGVMLSRGLWRMWPIHLLGVFLFVRRQIISATEVSLHKRKKNTEI